MMKKTKGKERGIASSFGVMVLLALLILPGCGGGGSSTESAGAIQASLSGPLAGAEVVAYRISDLYTPVESSSTKGGNIPDIAGTFDLGLVNVADDEWILVAVRGGTDLGTSGDQTRNSGTLYGLARAAAWRQGGNLNALTDILWRFSGDWFDEVSPPLFAERLDQIANILLQQDLDGNGIGVSDLMSFNPAKTTVSAPAFEYSQLFVPGGYAAGIYANLSEEDLRISLGDIFGTKLSFSPSMQMEDETKVSLNVFGTGSLALLAHDDFISVISGTDNNPLNDGQVFLSTIEEDAADQRDLFFARSSGTITLQAVPVGAGYPEADQTQILSWDGCDIVSDDLTQCTIDLQSNRIVTLNFGYKQTTLVDNHRFIDLSGRADTFLSSWDTSVDPVRVQLDVTVNPLDTDLLDQMTVLETDTVSSYYLTGLDASTDGTPFLLKVLSIAGHDSNHWVLNTEEAVLTDFILQGTGLMDRTLYPEDLAPEPVPSVSMQLYTADSTSVDQNIAYLEPSSDPNDPEFHIRIGKPLSNLPVVSPQATKSVSGGYTIYGSDGTSLTLTGSIDVTVAVEAGIHFKGPLGLGGVKNFKFIPKLGLKPHISITGNISSAFQKELSLMRLEFSRIKFMVGPVPVWITPTVEIVIGTDGRLSANLQTSVSYDMSVRGGVRYKRGKGVSLVKESAVNRDFDGPELVGNANLRAYLSVEPTLFIYDLMGPSLKIQPGLGLNATLLDNLTSPQCYDMGFALVASVDGKFTWSMEGKLAKILGLKKLNNKIPDFQIFRWATDLSRLRYNPCSDSPSALKVTGGISPITMVQNTSQDTTVQYTLLNNNLSPGYTLPWTVQVLPDNGIITASTTSGQLNAGGSVGIEAQLSNTASLAPGVHAMRLKFTNTDNQHAATPTVIEKYITVNVLEQLAAPSISHGTRIGPEVVTIDWLYGGNVEYLDGFNLYYAVRVDGACPAEGSAGWQKAGWADRSQRSMTAGVPYGNYCFEIEAVGKPGSQLYAYSPPYAVVEVNCDLDGDGYDSAYLPGCGGSDCCDDADGSSMGCSQSTAPYINPGVFESNFSLDCEDGIDNNCDGVDSFCING